jgi:hypothetical protein
MAFTLGIDYGTNSVRIIAVALSLPGFAPGSYAEIPGDVLDTTKSYTVAAWVKLNNVNGYQTFVSEDGAFLSAFFLQLRDDSHQFSFTIPYELSSSHRPSMANKILQTASHLFFSC